MRHRIFSATNTSNRVTHTVAETLIKSCAVDLVKCVLDENSTKQICLVPLSNDTVYRQIKDLAANMKNEIIRRLKSSDLSLQMDKSTEVTLLVVLLLFVRYVYQNSLHE